MEAADSLLGEGDGLSLATSLGTPVQLFANTADRSAAIRRI